MGFSAEARAYLGPIQLETAALFARQAYAFERERQAEAAAPEVMRFAVGSVLSAVAFLEATINELLADAYEGVTSETAGRLLPEARRLLAAVWPHIERNEILEKYQLTLALLSKSPIDRGASVWDNAAALVALRNFLVHYKPESAVILSSIDEKPVEPLKVEKRVKGKFSANPFYDGKVTAFICSHLSHGCAEWSVRSSIALGDAFFSSLAISAPYEHVRATLVTR